MLPHHEGHEEHEETQRRSGGESLSRFTLRLMPKSDLISWTRLFVVVVVVQTVVRAGILSRLMVSLSGLGKHRNDPSQHVTYRIETR
jgi:hypothetical protein